MNYARIVLDSVQAVRRQAELETGLITDPQRQVVFLTRRRKNGYGAWRRRAAWVPMYTSGGMGWHLVKRVVI